MNESPPPENSNEPTGTAACRPRVSLSRLLPVAVCLIGVGVGGVFWWTFGDGEQWWLDAWLPAKAEFRGKVMLDGEPLRGGQLTTWPDRRGVPRSLGFIGQDGEFALHTAIDGKYIEQAFVGRHRISIAQFAQQVGATAPKLTSPAKYTSPDTSGLVLLVDRDSSKNFAVFELVSDSPKSNDPPSNSDAERSSDSSGKPDADARDDSPSRPQ